MSTVASQALAKALAAAQKINATPGFDDGSGDVRPSPISDQATKHARKIYAGGLPAHSPNLSEESLQNFFNDQLERILPVKEEGDVIVQTFLSPEKRYAFLEHRSITEAAFTLTLDGLYFDGQQIKIRRPQDYNAQLAEDQQRAEVESNSPGTMLYKHLQSTGPAMASGAVYADIISTTVEDGPNKIFIGGLPHTMTDEECKEILGRYGMLKAFHLVKERDLVTGEVTRSKGFAFCEWRDPACTEVALANLNGMPVGDGRVLTVRRALPRSGTYNANQANNMNDAQNMGGTWSGPSLGVTVAGGKNLPSNMSKFGTSGLPSAMAIANSQSSSLMLTNGVDGDNKIVRYGYMGNLGYEAVTAYLSGSLPFQGDFVQVDEHIEGLTKADDIDYGGYDGGACALFPGERQWLELRQLMNKRIYFTGSEEESIHIEREYKILRHELWDVLKKQELVEKFGKPGRAVGLRNVITSITDMNLIQRAVDHFKEMVDEAIGEVKYSLYHPLDGGIVIIEMGCLADAYRVVRCMNGKEFEGRTIGAKFITMPADVKRASLLRLKNDLDHKFALSQQTRDQLNKEKQQKCEERMTKYLKEIQIKWISEFRESSMRRKKEKERAEEEAMTMMVGGE